MKLLNTRSLIFAALAVFSASGVSAAVYYVAKTGSNGNDGSSGSPWLTIQYAVNTAAAGDEIRVGAGTYTENVAVPYSATKNYLVLKGGYDPAVWSWTPGATPTVIEAANAAVDVVELRAVSVSVIGFTLRGGRYGVNGRGGLATESLYNVTHCVITNNTSYGIRIEAEGGAKAALNARNCLIARNGNHGIYINVDNAASNSVVYNCTIANNAGSGYWDNNASHKGSRIANCIIANNGGYGVRSVSTGDRDNRIWNTSVYGNVLGNLSSGHTDEYASQLRLYGAVINGQPMFVDAGAGDYRLASGSPCAAFGADLSASGVTDDIDGTARSGTYDLGCYQSAHSLATRYAQTYADASQPDDSGDGITPATAKKTIGAALAITAPSGTCSVTNGLYAEDVVLSFPVTLVGMGWESTVISNRPPAANPASTGIRIATNDVTVRGFTLVGGNVGIMAAQGLTTTGVTNNWIERCILRGATVGISLPRGNAVLWTQRLNLDRVVVTNNSSIGVFAAHRHSLMARTCLIAKNGGMGIRMTADNCPYDSLIYHCTIADNGGTGYQSENGSHRRTTFKNCIVSGNNGYGIRRIGGAAGTELIEHVWNTCVYGNALGNLYGDNVIDRLRIEGGVIATDPLFVGGGDYRLQNGSYAITRGLNLIADAFPVTVDLSGNPRTAWDMGCFESGYSAPARAATVYVDASRPDDSGAGTSVATAKKMINSGIAMADAGGTVQVAAGLYNETLLPLANVTVQGAGADLVKVTNRWHTAYFSETNATLAGVTLSAGWSRGLRFHAPRNTLRDAVVENATTVGAYVLADSNRIERTTLVRSGIGVHVEADVRVVLDSCRVVSNRTHGVYCSSKGSLFAMNSLFAQNGADGVYFLSDNAKYPSALAYCTISGNATNGFRDNQPWQSVTTMTNTIISANGGYGYLRQASNNRNNTLAYSLVYDNAQGNFSGGQIVLQAGMITNQLPLFASTDWTAKKGWRLTQPSPCRDTALNIGVAVDLAGSARPKQQGFDMGAYEFLPPQGFTLLVR